MPLISRTITGMYGGVSQQPPALRLDNQCTEMTNCVPSLADGVYKRAPAMFVDALRDDPAVPTEDMRIHFIDRDSAEKYAVMFTGDAVEPIEVYSLIDGVKKTVNLQDAAATAYAAATNPHEDIKTQTIADTTIVVNSTVVPTISGVLGGSWYPSAMVHIKHGVASQTYKVWVDGSMVSYTTGTTSAPDTWKTTTIATSLFNSLIVWRDALSDPENWQVVYGGSTILIYNTNSDDFLFKVEDSWGDAAMTGIKEQAPTIDDLPNRMPDHTSFGTDQFTMIGQNEYWVNYLCVEDLPSNPGTYLNLGRSVSGYGHHDSDVAESMTYWTGLVTMLLTGVDTGSGSYAVTDQPEAGDQWYAPTAWQISVDPYNVMSVWRTDGVRSKLRTYREYHRDGSFQGGGTPGPPPVNEQITHSAHEIIDFTNFSVKIYGEGAASTDSLGYYLRWKLDTTAGLNATGSWVETVAGGLDNGYAAATMPHQLVRETDGTFTFERITWNSRVVGDEDSAPMPSFIGNPINDVFFHKNRVGFLAGGNVVISKSGDYFDFFPTTALEVTDDDPIDITIPSTGVDALRWAAPSKGDLLIYGPDDQYVLSSGDQVFGAKTVSMDSNTNFPISPICEPDRCGANVYFVSPKGEFAALMEYFTQAGTLTDDAADVSAHAPKYLPYDTQYSTPSPTFNTMLFCTGMDQYIYGYKYYWAGDTKAQSAWFKWTLPYTVKAIEIMDNLVYIIGDTGLQFILETINMERVTDTGLEFLIHLDRREEFASTGAYSEDTGLTTFTMSYEIASADFTARDWTLVNKATGKEVDGLTWATATTLTVSGDYSAVTMVIGVAYDQTYTFSEFGVQSGEAKVNNPQGKLVVRSLLVAFQNTVMFDCIVTPKGAAEGGRVAITHQYTGVEIGLSTLGSVPLPSDVQRFLIMGDTIGMTIQLSNDSHFPATWYEASWEGLYTIRSRSIG